MGSPTSDDDPTRPVDGSAGSSRPGGQGTPQYPGPSYPPPGQPPVYRPPGQGPPYPTPGPGPGDPSPDSPTTRFPLPEGQRGQTAPFPQFGGFPPAGPAGPWPPQGAYGYGAPPPDRPRSNRGLVIALIVGLVILAGIAVALVYAFTRADGDTVAAARSTSTSAAAVSSTSAVSSSPARTDELLATVPVDFTDCAAADLAGDGDVAAVECGTSATQPGPETASFFLYDDPATLDEVFAEDAADFGPMPDGETCATAQGATVWNTEGVEGGEIVCGITDDGLVIAWTDREFGIEGVVTAPGTTQEELAALGDWWRSHSDFRK